MQQVMEEVTTGGASAEQIATFITALRMKGETAEEITAAAKVIRKKVPMIHAGDDVVSLDREEITMERETIQRTAGALAEGTNIFNISTATALVVAGGGLTVAKHVRKSLLELCGCADVIEALGVNLDLTPTQFERCLKEVGVCFIHGLLVQNGLKHLLTIREKVGIRTLFNLLDPLINPASAKIQVIGVYEPNLTERMAMVLQNLGVRKGLVIHGEDTLDEISITGKTKVTEFQEGATKTYFITPEDFGMERKRLEEIRGGTKRENAAIILNILKGHQGAKRDIVVLNAAATFMIAGKAKNFQEGVALANHSIDSGAAFRKLEELIAFTHGEQRYLRNEYQVEMDHDNRSHFRKLE
jgi:anthranilate phosphoribosyltransferase